MGVLRGVAMGSGVLNGTLEITGKLKSGNSKVSRPGEAKTRDTLVSRTAG